MTCTGKGKEEKEGPLCLTGWGDREGEWEWLELLLWVRDSQPGPGVPDSKGDHGTSLIRLAATGACISQS